MTHPAPPRTVLLTGVTGGLGAEIARQLLDTAAVHVVCLVRAPDTEAARTRVIDRLGLPAALRMTILPGRLDHPRLGLDPTAYDGLAARTELLIHCGAAVNFAASYERLAPHNVDGTLHMIALAQRRHELTGQWPHFGFVSTLATFMAGRSQGLGEIDETTIPTEATAGSLGYARSKVAAERVLREAAGRGLAVSILRPGIITGDSRTARTSGWDLLRDIMGALAELGVAPRISGGAPTDMIDVVAAGTVALLVRAAPPGETRCYHLVRPQPLPAAELFSALTRAGFRLDVIPPDHWQQHVKSNTRPAARQRAVNIELVSHLIGLTSFSAPHMRSEATWSELATLGVRAPALDSAFLDRLVAVL
ncbi:SDR family oxidoreductase [Streptomyces sp. NPDC059070]|uniref:SDR family oxidoreductase n=1 Tax=Streptomyces sp. NPDC059070 TaxID=3346713 RepID=UPI003679713E